jgi:hypothetical protein
MCNAVAQERSFRYVIHCLSGAEYIHPATAGSSFDTAYDAFLQHL